MHLEQLRAALLAMQHAEETLPFDEETLAYKVGGKIFAIVPMEWVPLRVTLKSDPESTLERRERYPEVVLPGYYAHKKYWNTVLVEGTVPRAELLEWIEDSWRTVVSGLTRKARAELGID